MALTPQESARLAELEEKYAPQKQEARTPSGAASQLTPEEQKRLEELESKYGRSPSQFPVSNLGRDDGSINEGQPIQTAQTPQMGDLGDRAMTQLESFGNTVSFGYLPQIQAAFEKINPDPSGGLDDELRAQGFTVPSQDYVDLRDENIMRQEGQAGRNPYDSAAGMVAGIATQAPIIATTAGMAGLGKVPGLVARTKDAIATGFGLGAVTNPGDIQGQVNILQGAERLKGASIGGTTGALGQAGGEAIAKTGSAIKNAPAALEKLSRTKAFKAAGAMLKDFRNARGDRSAEEVGEVLLSKGIVKAGDSIEDIASKTTLAKNEAGQKIRNIYSTVKSHISDLKANNKLKPREAKLLTDTELNGSKMADKIRSELSKNQKNMVGSTEVKGKMDEVLLDIANLGDDIDLSDAISVRNSIDQRIAYGKKTGELPLFQQQMLTARSEITKFIQNRTRAVGIVVKDKSLIKDLKVSNKEFSQLSTVENFATDRIARDNANRFFSLGDNVTSGATGAIGALTGDTPEERLKNGLIGFVGGRLTAKYGRHSTAVAATGAKRLASALKKPAAFAKYGEPLIEAAKRSPQEFQALINQLGKDPEFIKLSAPAGAR